MEVYPSGRSVFCRVVNRLRNIKPFVSRLSLGVFIVPLRVSPSIFELGLNGAHYLYLKFGYSPIRGSIAIYGFESL